MNLRPTRALRLAIVLGLPVFATAATEPPEVAALRGKAESGNAIAQYNLGLLHANPQGPAFDLPEAYVWLSVAAGSGARPRELANVRERMTPGQLDEAERRLKARQPSLVSEAPRITPAPLDEPKAEPVAAPLAEASLAADLRHLSEELAAAWKENEALKASANAVLADVRKRLAIAESALTNKDRELQALRDEVEASAPAVSEAEIARLLDDRGRLTREASELAEELAARRAEVQRVESENQRLLDATAKAKAADQAVRNRLEATLAELEAARTELTTTRREGETEVAQLRKQLAALQVERDQFAADAKQVRAEPAEDGGAELRLAELDSKLRSSLRAFTLQEAELAAVRRQLADATSDAETASEALDSLRPELEEAKAGSAEATAARAEAQRLQDELATALATAEAHEQELSRTRSSLAAAQDEARVTSAEAAQLRHQVRQMQEHSATLAQQLVDLRTRLAIAAPYPGTARPAPSRPGSPRPETAVAQPGGDVAAVDPLDPEPPPASPRTHVVSPGDTLSRIARDYYGNAARWPEILAANQERISRPDALKIGTELRIP